MAKSKKAKKAKAPAKAKGPAAGSCVGCVHLFLDKQLKSYWCTHPDTVEKYGGKTSMANHAKRPNWCPVNEKAASE